MEISIEFVVVSCVEIRKKCLLLIKVLLGPFQFLLSFESFVSCASRLFSLCCWGFAAISSFFCVTQFIKRLLVLQFCSIRSRNIAVHLLKKLLDVLKQNFTALTGILREILAGSSVASENSDLFAAMSFFNVPNSYVTCVTLAFSLKCVFSALNSCSSEMFA